jgi:predicted Rossmann fold flavoprotein
LTIISKTDVAIIGGGAAGFFAAINIAELNSAATILILEKGKNVLNKVKISGGGRCNVTHGEFDPRELSKNYPRGHKELLGPFHEFMTGDMMTWLEGKGVPLKIESDNRVFPTSDSSQTIIDCFQKEVDKFGIDLKTETGIDEIIPLDNQDYSWELKSSHETFHTKKLIIATGSSPKMWRLIQTLGHRIIDPVPSLFTFNIKDPRLEGLLGISVNAEVEVFTTKDRGVTKQRLKTLNSSGPLLITHWGMSGPCILKLSSWGARIFYELNHQFQLKVNWLPDHNIDSLKSYFEGLNTSHPKQLIYSTAIEGLPKRLWHSLLKYVEIDKKFNWSDISKVQLQDIAEVLCESEFHVNGKSTFKEEFVTAGGVDLKEIDFKTFKSKLHDNLFFSGEVLNIDAVTGGFNFQSAWTSAFICSKEVSRSLEC